MSRVGTYGVTSFVRTTQPFCLGQNTVIIHSKIDSKFLYYVLLSPIVKRQIESKVVGSTQKTISLKDIRELKILLPSKFEREIIGQFLSFFDEKIELNNSMNRTLEALGQALFKRWFVDYEFPNQEGKPYKSSGGKMIDSELGLIPATWYFSKIGSVLKTQAGGTPSRSKQEYWETGEIPWIASGKINEFRIIEPTGYITLQGLKNSSAKIMPKRTVLLALIGATVGQVSMLEIESSINQNVLAVVGSDDLPSEYVYFWIKNIIDKIITSQSGGAQQSINKKIVDNSPILIPDSNVMNEFYNLTKPIFERISLNCFQSNNLGKIRDTLLPKLMSGKIRVLIIKEKTEPAIHA